MTTRVDRLLLVNAMLGQFITGFAARSFVVGIPTIATALDADILGISWAIIAYQLSSVSLSVVFGRLGDVHGRRAIYGGGFVIMAASALLLGMSPDGYYLDSDGHNEFFGYYSVGVTFGLPLDLPPKYGSWSANFGVNYIGILADSAEVANDGGEDYELQGFIGISMAY